MSSHRGIQFGGKEVIPGSNDAEPAKRGLAGLMRSPFKGKKSQGEDASVKSGGANKVDKSLVV